MYKYKLPIGDWSNDGHGQCEYFIIETNCSPYTMKSLFKSTVEKYGIDKICAEYGEDLMTPDKIKELSEVKGFSLGEFYEEDSGFDSVAIRFAEMVLALMKVEDSTFVYKFIENTIPLLDEFTLGYGIFADE